MRQQRLEGRIVTQKSEADRHKELVNQINSIIERARDSTLMDAEYDARLIEDLFKCEPIKVILPQNDWKSRPQLGANPDRVLTVDGYIMRAKYSLEKQGFRPCVLCSPCNPMGVKTNA